MKSPLRYFGGKQKSAELIVSFFPKNINEYREPFIGGGSVFLEARSNDCAQTYWINDKFQELICFWGTVQDKYKCNRMQSELRKVHDDGNAKQVLNDYPENGLSDYDEAFYFFLRNRCSFSGATYSGGLSTDSNRFTESAIDRLSPMPLALQGVSISCADAIDVIKAPGKGVFIFLDPPYGTANGKYYGRNGELHAFDHFGLSEVLKSTKHKFLLTYGDHAHLHDLYSWANIKSWSKKYGSSNAGGNDTRTGDELFISNYEWEDA